MSKLLASILTRAVSDNYVERAEVVKSSVDLYWITVTPSHDVYWTRFRGMYPHFSRVAREYGAIGYSLTPGWLCPEFPSKEDLLNWLADTLSLTQGERKLLRLSVGV